MKRNGPWFRSYKLSLALAGGLLLAGGTTSSLHAQCDAIESWSPSCKSWKKSGGCQTLLAWPGQSKTARDLTSNDALITDRPDFTEASSTVGLGVAQLEFGYTFTTNDGIDSHSWGEPLLRLGILADWLEFRAGLFPATTEVMQGGTKTTTSGTEDLYLGFKVALTPQDGLLPEMALIPQMTVPTGSAAFTDDEVLPGMNWLYSWALTDDLATGGSTQWNSAVDGTGNTYTEWAQSWTLAASLTENSGIYTEWYAFFPAGSIDQKPQHILNGGYTYLFTPDIQWDARAGMGLNNAADDFFCGTGLSIRFR